MEMELSLAKYIHNHLSSMYQNVQWTVSVRDGDDGRYHCELFGKFNVKEDYITAHRIGFRIKQPVQSDDINKTTEFAAKQVVRHFVQTYFMLDSEVAVPALIA